MEKMRTERVITPSGRRESVQQQRMNWKRSECEQTCAMPTLLALSRFGIGHAVSSVDLLCWKLLDLGDLFGGRKGKAAGSGCVSTVYYAWDAPLVSEDVPYRKRAGRRL